MANKNYRGRYPIATPPNPGNSFGLGTSNAATLALAYPKSPLAQLGADADQVLVDVFLTRVLGEGGATTEFDPVLFPDGVDHNYGSAPNLDEVVVGGGGLPGSPYAPNIASPAVGADPASVPAIGVEITQQLKGAGSPFPARPTTNKPDKSSALISRQTLVNLQFGSSEPQG